MALSRANSAYESPTHDDSFAVAVYNLILVGAEFRRYAASGGRVWGKQGSLLERHGGLYEAAVASTDSRCKWLMDQFEGDRKCSHL